MQSENLTVQNSLQITFHFINGRSQSFDIDTSLEPGVTRQDIRQSIRRFMREEWWVLQLPQRTVFINPANILSVEFNPPLTSLEGEGVLDAKSMT